METVWFYQFHCIWKFSSYYFFKCFKLITRKNNICIIIPGNKPFMTYCPNKCSRIQCILDLILPANTIYFLKDLKVSRMYPTHVISNVILYSTNFVTTILRTIYVFHHAIHHIIYRITYLIFCHIAISPPLLNAYTFAASEAGCTYIFPHSRLYCRTEGRGTLSFLQVSTS